MGEEGKLYEDAIRLTVNKNLADIKTLLGWAADADSIEEKLKHIRQSVALLQEVEAHLAHFQGQVGGS